MTNYFIKYSYIHPKQPLVRVHGNDSFEFEVGPDTAWYDVVNVAKKSLGLNHGEVDEFTIDFMMEMK